MLIFGSGMHAGTSAAAAAKEALAKARVAFAGQTPKLAIVFASPSYADVDTLPDVLRETLGSEVPVVGGSAGGCVIGPHGVAQRGVSVVLLGGDALLVETRIAGIASPELVDVVPKAREIAIAADEAACEGYEHFTCLVFAPALVADGEALVAAARKGAGPRAQLAGGLTGDDLTLDRPRVFAGEGLRDDHVVLAGLFTKRPVGIAARHGCQPVGARRIVTRAEGSVLYELDHQPALELWLADARRAGAELPSNPKDLVLYLANHYELGFCERTERPPGPGAKLTTDRELVVRAPFELLEDGGVRLSGSIDEGRTVQVMQTSRKDLLRASTNAAADAVMRARSSVAGALVLSCSGRLVALGDDFIEEAALIRNRIGGPTGGACVFGEIAKSERDLDAFFNTTAVVVAFAS